MRILLPIIQYPPDTNTSGRLMSQLCDGLVSLGHEVTVVTAFPHYEHFRIWDEYRGKLVERRRENGIDIIRLYTYASGKKNMVNRLVSYLTFNTLASLFSVLSRKQWDVILCPNGSFFTGLTAWLVDRVKSVAFVYNVQDLYPEVPIRAGQLHNRYAIATLRALENFMYKKAAHITVISQPMLENLVSKGVVPEKITVIPNFVDTEFIRPLPKDNNFARQNGLADKFVVTHAGNLGYVYDLETLLETAAALSARKDILFLIVGNGVAKASLEKKAQDLKLNNVRFMPFQPHEDLPWLRAASNVQVSLYKNGAANESFPSKVYEIMASGRPLLASSDSGSGVESLVKTAECGVCVRPGSAKHLADAILKLHDDPALWAKMGQRGRRYAEQNYSKQVAVTRYNELLHKVVALRGERGRLGTFTTEAQRSRS
jgi:colanic acid biosynthesis glycosyl transferase WcaI